jgi:hypothetical protein
MRPIACEKKWKYGMREAVETAHIDLSHESPALKAGVNETEGVWYGHASRVTGNQLISLLETGVTLLTM